MKNKFAKTTDEWRKSMNLMTPSKNSRGNTPYALNSRYGSFYNSSKNEHIAIKRKK